MKESDSAAVQDRESPDATCDSQSVTSDKRIRVYLTAADGAYSSVIGDQFTFPALPFVACRIGDRDVAPVMAEAMGIAAKSMGATGFIDMPLLHADNATDTDFRSQVLRHIR